MLAFLLAIACAGPEPAEPVAAPPTAPATAAPTPPAAVAPTRAVEGASAAGPGGRLGSPAARPDSAVLTRARARVPDAVSFADQAGAKLLPADGGAFTLAWAPDAGGGTVVSLHGHEGWAHEDLRVWLPHARQHGFRLLAVQWWVGTGDAAPDYLNPEALYRTIDDALRREGAVAGRVLLHGFSRGATVTYALAAMDARHGRWFDTVVANAGGAHLDFPPTAAVDGGRYGDRPYTGQDWLLFCGGRDPDPKLNGCPAMRTTKRWIEARGGEVTLLEDASADHGGFMRNAANVRKAIEAWRRQAR